MANIPVTVTLDGQGTIRCSPDPARVPRGNHTIVWQTPTPGTSLESIVIDQGPGQPVWPGGTPAKQPDGTITVDDPVEGSDVVTFKYSVTVRKSGETWSVDPEIKNEPNP